MRFNAAATQTPSVWHTTTSESRKRHCTHRMKRTTPGADLVSAGSGTDWCWCGEYDPRGGETRRSSVLSRSSPFGPRLSVLTWRLQGRFRMAHVHSENGDRTGTEQGRGDSLTSMGVKETTSLLRQTKDGDGDAHIWTDRRPRLSLTERLSVKTQGSCRLLSSAAALISPCPPPVAPPPAPPSY